MKTVVFYETDGAGAKALCAKIRDETKGKAQALLASAYSGERLFSDKVEFTADVPDWRRKLVEQLVEKAGKKIIIYVAVLRAEAIVNRLKAQGHTVIVRTAATFQGEPEQANAVLIMPDVPEVKQKLIAEFYGEDKVTHAPGDYQERIAAAEPPAGAPHERFVIIDPSAGAGDPIAPPAAAPEPAVEPDVADAPAPRKCTVSQDGEQFFVKRGAEVVGGPFEKRADAKAFAAVANNT